LGPFALLRPFLSRYNIFMPKSKFLKLAVVSALFALPRFSNAQSQVEELFLNGGASFSYSAPQSQLYPAPSYETDAALTLKAAPSAHYLDLDGLDLTDVPAAPEDGSYEDKNDFEVLFDWQKKRTPEQCAAARAEMEHSFKIFFGKISPFKAPEPAEVTTFFKNVSADSVAAHRFIKDAYKRQRPFLRDTRIKPCVFKVGGYAYPSGHATISRLFALILGDLVPSRKKEFLTRADEAALNRVIAGVHHPTDIEAGKILADVLYKNLKEEPEFSSDMKTLKRFLSK